jgi:hypothetical protein
LTSREMTVAMVRDGDLMARIAGSQLPEAEPSIDGGSDPEGHSDKMRRPIFRLLNRELVRDASKVLP